MEERDVSLGRTMRDVRVTDGDTTEACTVEETVTHSGRTFVRVEGDHLEGWVEQPDEMPRLDCSDCRQFETYERESETVVRCGRCGKRHSNDSLYLVEPGARYTRVDETGELADPPRRVTA